jgi:hypothetical protein
VNSINAQDLNGPTLEAAPAGYDLLVGDVMTQLWGNDDGGVATMAAKKKKPAKKPAKKPKPRPTRNRPGCASDDPSCGGNPHSPSRRGR